MYTANCHHIAVLTHWLSGLAPYLQMCNLPILTVAFWLSSGHTNTSRLASIASVKIDIRSEWPQFSWEVSLRQCIKRIRKSSWSELGIAVRRRSLCPMKVLSWNSVCWSSVRRSFATSNGKSEPGLVNCLRLSRVSFQMAFENCLGYSLGRSAYRNKHAWMWTQLFTLS